MDGHSHGQLTRTQSLLLRSSPTVRSSIQSLSSFDTITHNNDNDRSKRDRSRHHHQQHPDNKTVYFSIIVGVTSLIFLSLIYFMYNRHSKAIPTSEKLLFVLVLIALAIFYLGRNKYLMNELKSILAKHHSTDSPSSQSVEWFIGGEHQIMSIKGAGTVVAGVAGVECYTYTNGDYYEGEFNRGKSNGSGVYNYSVNGRYEGEWVEGKYDGYGIESWAKGSRYRGQYKCGMRHGVGIYWFYTGDSYSGEWFNGQYHGVGVQSCSDGSCFVGVFKFGVKHGLGSYHFRNGDRYAGEYFGDKIHGFGVYHFANGHCYEGSWHEGRKQGYGMYTFRNGEAKCGEWNCGSLKSPLPPLTDSVLRAVQSARKAAESAINLRRVDEQVNKAVFGANRAATAARVAAVKAVQNRMNGKFYDTNA